jgi:tetratricopeptide (TPR) repeat protein
MRDRKAAIDASGLKVLALNVDGLEGGPADPAAAKAALEGIRFPYEAGFADADLVRRFDILLRKLIALPRPLPVPSSILIDGSDLVAAVYRGPTDIDALLTDLPALTVPGPKRLALAVPFAGLRQTRGMPSLFDTMDGVARAWTDAGYPDDAIRYYTRLLKIQPRRVGSHVDLGTALAASGRTEEAEARYREALALAPEHVGAMNNLASLLAARGATAEAVDLFRKVLAIEPVNMFALENLATALMAEGNQKEATALLREASRLQPDNRSVLNNLAVAVARGGNDDEAIALYERLLALEPGNVPAHINLGIALMRKSRPGDALSHLKEAVRLAPDYAEARYHCGVALLRAGQREDATAELAEAARLEPEHRMALYNLGIALALLGRTDEAVARMAEALGAPSQVSPAALRLTWALASGADPALRDGARAVAIAERACAQARDNPDCLDAMAAAYAEAGRFDEAVRTARGALERAEAAGPQERIEAIRARLRGYESGRPWRQAGGP